MQYNQDGHHKRTMDADRAHYQGINATKRSTRQANKQSSTGVQWYLVGPANRCALERLAATVSTVPNLPPMVPEMGTARSFPTHCPGAGARPV